MFMASPVSKSVGHAKKKPALRRASVDHINVGELAGSHRLEGLLYLAFLVDHMLANDGVVLQELHLVRRVLLVLVRGVEVAGVGRGDQADLVALGSHDSDPPS